MERNPIEEQMKINNEMLDKAKQNGIENCGILSESIKAIGEKDGKIVLVTMDGKEVSPEIYLGK